MQGVNENMEQDNNDELKPGEDELYAWLELRLHPLLIKAMHRLGFKEPTPIQKACFPAGAHQGKVCHMGLLLSCCYLLLPSCSFITYTLSETMASFLMLVAF
jgi:hypothetical protein